MGFLVHAAGRHVFGYRTGCSHRFSKIAFFTLVHMNSLATGHKLYNAIPILPTLFANGTVAPGNCVPSDRYKKQQNFSSLSRLIMPSGTDLDLDNCTPLPAFCLSVTGQWATATSLNFDHCMTLDRFASILEDYLQQLQRFNSSG